MSTCSDAGCNAPIIWAETHLGKAQPFDREPNPEGNRILLGRGPSRPPLALDVDLVDAGHHMLGTAIDECRYMPHHATCKAVKNFR